MKSLAAVSLLLLAASCASLHVVPLSRVDEKVDGFTKHYAESLFQIAERGRFSVELLTRPERFRVGENGFGLVVHDRSDNDVGGAEVSAVARLAGRGPEVEVRVEEGRGGRYHLTGLDLAEPGDWELTVAIRKGSLEDRAVFLLPVSGPRTGGRQ